MYGTHDEFISMRTHTYTLVFGVPNILPSLMLKNPNTIQVLEDENTMPINII